MIGQAKIDQQAEDDLAGRLGWRNTAGPVLAVLCLLPVLAYGAGLFLGKSLQGYAFGTAIVLAFLANPEFLDQTLYRRFESAWGRRRARLKRANLTAAERHFTVRQYWIARVLRVGLWAAFAAVALGLACVVIGVVIRGVGFSWATAEIGLGIFFGGTALFLLMMLVVVVAPVRSPEQKLLDGYFFAHDAARLLHGAKWSRGVVALLLIVVGGVLSLL